MPRGNPTDKLAKLTLRLIRKDLKRIQNFKVRVPGEKRGETRLEDPPPGLFALALTRYHSALMSHRRTTERIENAEREALKKLSVTELEKLAGVRK